MASPYIGEIRIFAGNFAPQGWALCNGAILPISENDTLFNLIGTTYGGDGQSTFALPNLQSRIPIGVGTLSGSTFQLAQTGGAETVTLTTAQLPPHAHYVNADGANANSVSPQNAIPGTAPASSTPTYYLTTPSAPTNFAPNAIGGGSGGQPISMIQPIVVLNFIISLYGVYPSPT